MITLATVRGWRPDGLLAASQNLTGHLQRVVAAGDRLDQAGAPPGWTGAAADSAALSLGQLTSGVREAAADAATAARAMREAAEEIQAVQGALAQAEAMATQSGVAVGPDGELTESPLTALPPDQLVAARAQRDRDMTAVRARLEQVLRTAADIDAKLAGVLRGIDTASPASVTPMSTAAAADAGAVSGAITAPTAPAGGDPQANAAWWATLARGEQDAIVRDRPEIVGGMDGVPAAVRSQANLNRIPAERARLQQELAQAESVPSWGRGASADAQRRAEQTRAKLTALQAVERTMSDPGEHQLLLLDTGGRRLKAAVANGDVDHARNVAVFTPGLTTTVENSLRDYDRQLADMRQLSSRLGRQFGDADTSTAAVTWIGYEAPQLDEIPDPTHSVAAPLDAEHGGQALNQFYRGLDASHQGDPHLVALGHSYGSTTTGYALNQPAGVDDTVLFGSPGAGGAHSAGDLQAGNLYILEAKDDPVADIGSFGSDPNQLPGATDLATTASTGPDGQPLAASTGHSQYLLDRSTSQYNLAAVLAGHPERTIPNTTTDAVGDPGGIGDLIQRGINGSPR